MRLYFASTAMSTVRKVILSKLSLFVCFYCLHTKIDFNKTNFSLQKLNSLLSDMAIKVPPSFLQVLFKLNPLKFIETIKKKQKKLSSESLLRLDLWLRLMSAKKCGFWVLDTILTQLFKNSITNHHDIVICSRNFWNEAKLNWFYNILCL